MTHPNLLTHLTHDPLTHCQLFSEGDDDPPAPAAKRPGVSSRGRLCIPYRCQPDESDDTPRRYKNHSCCLGGIVNRKSCLRCKRTQTLIDVIGRISFIARRRYASQGRSRGLATGQRGQSHLQSPLSKNIRQNNLFYLKHSHCTLNCTQSFNGGETP